MIVDENGTDSGYRRLFDNSADGILIADRETLALRYANPAIARLLGYPATELTTMAVADLQSAGEDTGTGTFGAMMRGEGTSISETAFVTKEQTLVYADVTASALSLDGRPMIAGFFRDVTARRDSQLALVASELRYRRLFESAKDGILILAADSGVIIDVNPFLMTLLAHTRDELIGHQLWEIGPFKNITATKAAMAVLRAEGYVRYEHLPLQASDGRTIDVEFVCNVYRVGDEAIIQCNVRDITQRRHDEAALRMMDSAIGAVSQGILITDSTLPDHPIVFASPGFEAMTGYAAAEVRGQNCRFLQGRDTDPAAKAEIREAVAAGHHCMIEILNYRKDGKAFWNHLTLSPIKGPAGEATHFVGVQTDVTERRQMESQFRQAQKMEAVGRLAGGIAHDFNNVLSVISSYSELVLHELPATSAARADVEEIKRAGLRATQLTRQLLTFSRKQSTQGKVLDLYEAVAATSSMLGQLLGADIQLTLLPVEGATHIKADPGQVEQILMNLVINARDAMPTGGELTIKVENVELDAEYARAHHDVEAGSYVMLAVTDTGTGMDHATQARVFEPFFTTKEPGKGTGLGLATVFGIVKQSSGHIWLYSELDQGTTFRLYFPRVMAARDVASPGPTAVEFTACVGTILVVEDDDQVRSLTVNLLRRCGYVVLTAPNAGEALLVCENYGAKIDLLLTDVVLPRMSGRALSERLLPMRPRMKVLYMSGYTDDAILQHGILDSGVEYLQKPLTPSALLKKVREVLAG